MLCHHRFIYMPAKCQTVPLSQAIVLEHQTIKRTIIHMNCLLSFRNGGNFVSLQYTFQYHYRYKDLRMARQLQYTM